MQSDKITIPVKVSIKIVGGIPTIQSSESIVADPCKISDFFYTSYEKEQNTKKERSFVT